jgi:hypothetical protein
MIPHGIYEWLIVIQFYGLYLKRMLAICQD